MAIANVTVTETVAAESNQPHRQALVSLDFDTSYPTGGYPIPLAAVTDGDGYEIVMAEAQPVTDYRFWWNPSTKKLLVFVLTTGTAAEVAGSTDLSALTSVLLNCILK